MTIPSAVGRPLDHFVLCVRDLDAAAAAYERLGFTLTPQAVHPFGTTNRLVQLGGNFLEILAIADPALIRAADPGGFSFAAFNADFLERQQGMSMLVFASTDAGADQADFARRGLATYPPFDFRRTARLPDGSEVTIGFSLAFVTAPAMPKAAFFVCQQHAPQHFWKADYQRHLNGALSVDEVIMTAPEPASLAPFYAKLLPEAAIDQRGQHLTLMTPRGRVGIVTPAGFRERFGAAAPSETTPRFAALRISVQDLAVTAAILRDNGVSAHSPAGRIVVEGTALFGLTLEFAGATSP